MTKRINVIKTNAEKIVKNDALIANKIFSNKEFTAFAKSIDPNLHTRKRTAIERSRSALALVRTQGFINEFLRPKGMVLKSRNYYNEFYVAKDKKAENEIVRYHHIAENATANAQVLYNGIFRSKTRK